MASRLRRVRPGAGGWSRRRRGRGFEYLDGSGRTIRDPEALARIRALAIPPAWEDVWVCDDPAGHLQATGVDAAGRTQYRYHDEWRRRRDREKHRRVEGLAEALPALRERVAADLARRGPVRERVLACAVRMLDRGAIRVGTEEYARANGTIGLATLRKEHLTIARDGIHLRFTGKAGKDHDIVVHDDDIVPLLRSLRRGVPGEELLAYRDRDGWKDVRAADINGYLQDALGDGFSAKDFRTWRATVLAAVSLAAHDPDEGKKAVTVVVREVADELGNTPAVARSSYIDPRVIDRFLDEGVTVAVTTMGEDDVDLDRIDAAVLALLRDEDAIPVAA